MQREREAAQPAPEPGHPAASPAPLQSPFGPGRLAGSPRAAVQPVFGQRALLPARRLVRPQAWAPAHPENHHPN